MSRRTLRSAGEGFRRSGRTLAIPNNLPASGTIGISSAKLIKREHEADAYVRVRHLRTGQQIVVAELRGEWQTLLLPITGSMHIEDGQGAALAAEAEMPDRPPLYIGACYGSEAVQQLLETELVTLIAKADWRELWVLLGQIAACIERLASPDAVRPWWARTGGSDNEVIEYVDLVARESVGAVDAPIDVEDTSSGAVLLVKDEEALPPGSGGRKHGRDRREEISAHDVVRTGMPSSMTELRTLKRRAGVAEEALQVKKERLDEEQQVHEDATAERAAAEDAAAERAAAEEAAADRAAAEQAKADRRRRARRHLAQLKKMRCVGCNTPHPCQELFKARDVDVYDEKGGPDRLGWYCAPGRGSLHRGVCRHCASEADGWCEGGGPGASTDAEAALILLNECQAHRSKLMSWDVEDVVQYPLLRL